MGARVFGRGHGRYILVGHEPVPEPDLFAWAAWLETADRVVKQTNVGDVLDVSTVFLGLDHNYGSAGPPLLFETMVFQVDLTGAKHYGGVANIQERYATWDEAVAGHAHIVAQLRAQFPRLGPPPSSPDESSSPV